MTLSDITTRTIPPSAWAEGENIPWSDPDFSRRMLAEHLTQEHNLASRRAEIIDRQVQWIHNAVLDGTTTRILDLTCGPGLYASRLARLGHVCVGIDYAPAAIHHAQETARRESLACTYRLGDVRTAQCGDGYGLAMMLYGQLNVFRRSEARAIVEQAFSALVPGGLLLLEPQRFATVEKSGQAGSSWYSCGEGGGLFSDRPHLCLTESSWDARKQATTQRFFIVDAATGAVTRHAMTTEAYTDGEFHDLLVRAGFTDIRFFPSLVGLAVTEDSQAANLVVLGRKVSPLLCRQGVQTRNQLMA
jgi:SAM-dependent methyltransferase